MVETGEHHVATEDVLKLLRLVNDLPRTVLLVNSGVDKLGRKAKVNEVERHLIEDISLQIFLGEVFSEIHQYVIQFKVVVDVACRVDLLEHGDDVDAELIGAALAHLVPATLEVGLQILAQARHDHVRVFLEGFSPVIDQDDRSRGDYLRSLGKL